jgi:GTPase SAR1 family protein
LYSDGRKNFHEKVMQACSNAINVTLGEKIIVVGDHNVGKTSMMRRYVEEQYSDGYKVLKE